MSRIGKKKITIPDNIAIDIKSFEISIQGPKGKLSHFIPDFITLQNNTNTLQLQIKSKEKKLQALYGLYRSIINNMVIGVSQGFEKKLIINGVGYRCYLENNQLVLNLGYSHPIYIKTPQNISIKVENNTYISINGIDKQTVGEVAATIRSMRPPEPYKGKGIKYIDEIIKRKIGKAGK
uniref:Large ribosomal subunit protein uL6c n=1 Tax=Caloglossa beccarii TaxID=131038 RepID=A0A1Z1M8X1_9FLOR|nr:ribosomal protein L6 [Caloglossa beccarii]ARW62333.1 ribosomal protein L6 [Caloglossa beccarii]